MGKQRKSFILILIMFFCFLLALSACGQKECEHEWEDATCSSPKICMLCDEELGEKLGHDYSEQTCTEDAICSRCGRVAAEALGHEYFGWKSNESVHWQECSHCLEETNKAAHTYVNNKCSVCGFSKSENEPTQGGSEDNPTEEVPTQGGNEDIPTEDVPTGDVPTEDVPTQGGNEDLPTGDVPTQGEDGQTSVNKPKEEIVLSDYSNIANCKHLNKEYKVLDLAHYGCCEGEFSYFECSDCGFSILENGEDFGCSLRYETEYSFLTNNGDEAEYVLASCVNCDFVLQGIFVEFYYNEDDCSYDLYEYKFVLGDESVYMFMGEYYHRNEEMNVTYSFEKLGPTCSDGVIVSSTCKLCNYSESYTTYDHVEKNVYEQTNDYGCRKSIERVYCLCCEETVRIERLYTDNCSFEMVSETIDSENENHIYKEYSCRYCDLSYTVESYIEKTECSIKSDNLYKYYYEDELIYEFESSIGDDMHEYEHKVEEFTGNCSDGYLLISTCTVCGDVYSNWKMYHTYEESEEVDLREKGLCGGYDRTYCCIACGYSDYINIDDYNCNWNVIGKENNEVIYYCNVCKTTKTITEITDTTDACTTITTVTYTYTKDNGTVVYETSKTSINRSHNYDYEFTLIGDSCEDGYNYIGTCVDCGLIDRDYDYDHFDDKHNEMIEGTCGEIVTIHECLVCGEISSVEVKEYSCKWETLEMNENMMSMKCSTCGVERIYVRETELLDNCVILETYTLSYVKDGVTLNEYIFSNSQSQHEYVYTYEDNDNNCDTGYEVYQSCSNCDYTEQYRNYGHDYSGSQVSLSDYGILCGGNIYTKSCSICNMAHTEVEEHCWFEWIDQDETGTIHQCKNENCGVIKHISYAEHEKDENCKQIISYTITYIKDEEVLYTYSFDEYNTVHNYDVKYDLDGDTCIDGVRATYTCIDCGNSFHNTWLGSHVDKQTATISLSDYGFCGGNLDITYCQACNEIYEMYAFNLSCELSGENIDDCYYEKCSICLAEFNDITTKEFIGDCQYKVIHNYIVKCGDTQFESNNYYYNTEHSCKYEYSMQGTTCDDGVIVFESCEICGYNDKYTHYGHELIKEHINVSEYGLCYGIFEREYCNVCGDTVYSREFSDCCYDENMTCYNCGVSKIENTEITELGGCKYKEDRIISYTINDEVIFSYEISDVDESHNIVENAIMNGNVCQFGYVLERYCDDCSYRENNTVGFDHLYAERTITVNQSDSCGLYVIKEIYCERCESLSHVEVLENNCEWETIEEDANSIYQCCTKCNVLYSNILYFDEETKLVYNYINYSFNGEELYYGIICYIGDAYPFSYVNDLNYEFTVGTYEIRSTNHDDNSVSSITFRANKDLLVSFDYYTSCEENCDYLLVCVNGEEIDKATGDDGNVKHLELNLSEGDTLSFRYCKDSSVNNGEDCAYIKNLTYTD